MISDHVHFGRGVLIAVCRSAVQSQNPVTMRHWPVVGPILGRRRRRRANIGPTTGHCLMLTGKAVNALYFKRKLLLPFGLAVMASYVFTE